MSSDKKHWPVAVWAYDNVRKIITRFSPTMTTMITYSVSKKKMLDLKNPKDFNQKIMWLKLKKYSTDPVVAKCVDKYAVREYVESCGCGELLNEIYGVYNSAEEVDFETLPESFALKLTTGCGCNLICSDKSKLDYTKARETIKKWYGQGYYLIYAEMQYKNVPERLICEKYIDSLSALPTDYKFYCVYGKVIAVLALNGRDTEKEQLQFFDENWNYLGSNRKIYSKIDKPISFEMMKDYCKKLAGKFPFVRVDFYEVNGKPMFGELTFTPAGGIGHDYPDIVEKMLFDELELPKE